MNLQPHFYNEDGVEYPDTDGQPVAENTLQFRWIVTIEGGLDALFRDNPNVFVAGDLLWYPVRGDNTIRTAPDAMVVFGRPKVDRGSYMQWREGGIPPQVVFEVLSPGNRAGELESKLAFYERYGVEEYYQYDPDRGRLRGWMRSGEVLVELPSAEGWTSPRLGVRLDLDEFDLVLTRPDGQRFQSYLDLDAGYRQARQEIHEERERRENAERQAATAEHMVNQERQRAERLVAQLRALGVEPDA
jgi:Uma2 family endonuclease